MKKVKQILLDLVFVSLLISMLWGINQIFVPKKTMRNSDWPVTSTYEQFYQMEKNSIDALFLGSSFAMNAFIPQEIYEQYGITSYNLASEQQSLLTSYFWLKEALQYQSPKTVFLETRFLFSQHPESVFNSTEGLVRSAIDPMKMTSKVKWEAVNAICASDGEQNILSYYLTNLRFHGRWNDLEDIDFRPSYVAEAPLFGYALNLDNHITSYTPFEVQDALLREPMVPLMEEYLNRIVSLCKEEGIHLVLISVPSANMTDGMHGTLTEYAESHEITYLNYSLQDLYETIGAEFPWESVVDHENFKGAQKMSRVIGALLSQEIEGHVDGQFEAQRAFYQHVSSISDLPLTDDMNTYLSLLQNEDFTVLISVRKDMAGTLSQSTMDALHALGLKASYEGQYYKSYYAVISQGHVVENMQDGLVSLQGKTADGMSQYAISSGGMHAGSQSSIVVDQMTYGLSDNGINIVVYDNVLHKVIDSVNLNTHDGDGMYHMQELARKR